MGLKEHMLTEEEYEAHIEKMGGRTKYTLSYEEYRDCVSKAVVATFSNIGRSKKPTSLFEVAPCGSGKTGLAAYSEVEFTRKRNERVIRIDPDLIGVHHKNYVQINEEIPEDSYSELQKFIKTLLDDTIRPLASERRINVLTEGTFASKDGYIKIIQDQIKKGYNIQIDTIVVHRFEQLLSCFERQQDRIEGDLPPRINSVEYCDRTYNKFMETLKYIEDNNLYTNINVYRRGKEENSPILVWSTGDPRYRTATEAVNDERKIGGMQIIKNKEIYIQRIEALKERIARNPESVVKRDQLEQIQLLEQEFYKAVEEHEKVNR